MDKNELFNLTVDVEGTLNASMKDAHGVEVFDAVYYVDDVLVAGCTRWGDKLSWVAEVGVLIDYPIRIGEVVFKTSTDGGKRWNRRGRPPASLVALGTRMREHIVAMRDKGRFATREQGLEAVHALKVFLAAVEAGDLMMIEDGVRRAQALLSTLTPEVQAPRPYEEQTSPTAIPSA